MESNLSFDHILTNRIKFGKSQIRTFLIVSLIEFLDGSQLMYLVLLNVILYKEWLLDHTQLIILGSVFNIGLVIGAILCGYSADKYGRRTILIYGCILQVLSVFCTTFAQDFQQMIVLQLFYGVIIGLGVPISQIIITEITPQLHRGQLIVALQIMYILGRLWTLLLAYYFLESLSEGNWRGMALCNTLPCLLCLIGSILYLRESPRHLICQGEIRKGIEGINQMGEFNDQDYSDLSANEIQQIQNWQYDHFQSQIQNVQTMDLLNEENLPITWRIYVVSVISTLIFGGIYLLLPFLFADEGKTLQDLFYSVIVEIPALIIVYMYIDQWGRKPIVLWGIGLCFISLTIIWIWKEKYLIFGFVTFKFFTRITSLAFNPLAVESYSTVYRSIGVGTAQGLSSLAGVFSPMIVSPIYHRSKYLPFFLGSIIKAVMFFIMLTFPKDLTQKPLDDKKNE